MIAGKYHWAPFFQQLAIINNNFPAENFGGKANDDFENSVKHVAVMIINN
jgi:hypothetical protein